MVSPLLPRVVLEIIQRKNWWTPAARKAGRAAEVVCVVEQQDAAQSKPPEEEAAEVSPPVLRGLRCAGGRSNAQKFRAAPAFDASPALSDHRLQKEESGLSPGGFVGLDP